MPPIESIVATSSMLICHYWSPYLSERETVLEAQLIGLGLWKIKYRRISTIQIMTMTGTGSSTLGTKFGAHVQNEKQVRPGKNRDRGKSWAMASPSFSME
jgi:hypothetical protein